MSLLLERYEEILERLRAELIAHYGPRLVSVAVFGSVGRGTPRSPLFLDDRRCSPLLHDSDGFFQILGRRPEPVAVAQAMRGGR
jgi:hypothetical protein